MKKTLSLLLLLCPLMIVSAQPGVRINGVEWATRNVGRPGRFVKSPEDYGLEYRYNTRTPHSGSFEDAAVDEQALLPMRMEWQVQNDPCPKGWRVPTATEMVTMLNATQGCWVDGRGAGGYQLTDTCGGASIFLPACEKHYDIYNDPAPPRAWAWYWSGTLFSDHREPVLVEGFYFDSAYQRFDVGFAPPVTPIRCVRRGPAWSITLHVGAGGEAVVARSSAEEGMLVGLAQRPQEGYVFAGWRILRGETRIDDPLTGYASFDMPAGEVVLRAEFVPTPD